MADAGGIGTEYCLFGGAGLISLLAFGALILVPALGVLRAHLGEGDRGGPVGVRARGAGRARASRSGSLIVYYWPQITQLVPGRLEPPSLGAPANSPIELEDPARAEAARRKALQRRMSGDARGALGGDRVGRRAARGGARGGRKALGASVALIDRSSAVLAVAASSSAEETKLLSEAGADVASAELRVADAVVGELRYRPRGRTPPRRR